MKDEKIVTDFLKFKSKFLVRALRFELYKQNIPTKMPYYWLRLLEGSHLRLKKLLE